MQKNDFSKTILSIIKAIGKKNDLKINFFENDDDFFTFNQNLVDEKNLNLPKNSNSLANRALSDLAAGYFLFHNKNLHKKIASDFQENSQFLDIFEKMRIVSLISKDYLGIEKNIILQIKNDIKKSSQFNKINALSLFLLKDEKIFEIARNSFAFDDEIIKKVQNLSQNLENQEEFALEVKEIIEFLQKEEAKRAKKTRK